ncbi:glycosyltransferase [Clostridium sp. Cult3]|uniref:glycosyltransferase n=1 Tax=Clostridium sp. Cult3 TaxID=2079004 RepID=UPI001F3F8620|nr:glycosyltransferase [Clostridium sp. Cult3]MCF6460034.1 hypothetical protein [Clostridium sp. Cult3]
MSKVSTQWLILTGVPFQNSGGGQRAAQIAKTLLGYGHHITYVYAIDYIEKGNSQTLIENENFKTMHVNRFSISKFIKNLKKDIKLIILIEVPHPSFLPIINSFKNLASNIIYELIDPWDTELGKGWYDIKIEWKIIDLANILTATALSLKKRLEQKTNRLVHLIPNAYDDILFNPHIHYNRPIDLPDNPIIGYVGALWGSWFDIHLIIKLANKYSNYNIVLIGEYNDQFDGLVPSNVHFVGLKPQYELPAYLFHFQLGLIPFKVNDLTFGVNPLKVYEYLAMGLPVVSTNMPELKEMPNVFLAKNDKQFLHLVKSILDNDLKTVNVEHWLKKHNWHSRVNKLLLLTQTNNKQI